MRLQLPIVVLRRSGKRAANPEGVHLESMRVALAELGPVYECSVSRRVLWGARRNFAWEAQSVELRPVKSTDAGSTPAPGAPLVLCPSR